MLSADSGAREVEAYRFWYFNTIKNIKVTQKQKLGRGDKGQDHQALDFSKKAWRRGAGTKWRF